MVGKQSLLAAYGWSLVAVALAVIVRLSFDSFLADRLPFHFFFPAICFAAWYGGRWPALVALAASTLAAVYFILEPRYSFEVRLSEYEFGTIMFVMVGLAAIAMMESLRHAWEVAAEKSKLLASVLSRIGDGVIVTDLEGRVASVNPVAEVLTGWGLTEAKGQPLSRVFRVIHERTRLPIDSPVLVGLLVDDDSFSFPEDTVLVTRDGSEIPVEVSASPYAQSGGTALVFRDVSDRRRLFTEYRRHAMT